MSQTPPIHLEGAREHNLAGVSLDLEPFTWTAVCGPSGSGKSSLVFDTLVKTSEARFLGSLSARARAFFGKLGRSRLDVLSGLPPAIAIGEKATTPSARSTVGTLTGCLDLLRLVFAREAIDPGGETLTRSHFSFNHPLGACEACGGLGLEDRVDPALLIADPKKSLRAGALVPTLKNGYTVYSQVTLEVMDTICHAHGFDVDTPWAQLTDGQRDVILYGTKALKVPFGKHAIESRLKWEGITARPREEGYYKGLVPVIEETLKRNRNANILRFVRSAPCSTCAGTRLGRAGRDARIGDWTLPAVLAVPADALATALDTLPAGPVWLAIRPSLLARVKRLVRLGLGHLTLARTSTSLSGGEAQRVRLAAQAGTELCGLLFALDEPTLGLHPESQAGMTAVLEELLARGNTLVTVEHDPDMVRHADRVLKLGPGAGTEGGRLVADEGLAGAHRAPDPLGPPPIAKASPRAGSGRLVLDGATLHNLKAASLELRLGALNVICGPSGAGKSSLVFGTLLPAITGKPGGPFGRLSWLDGPAQTGRVEAADARPIGKTPRSTPATWCGLFDLVRKAFAHTDEAIARGLTASHFSFNNKHARCPVCEGLGVTRIGLHLFEDVELECEACHGQRFEGELLEVRLTCGATSLNIAEVLGLTFQEANVFFAGDGNITRLTGAMLQLGLGYLTLGQSSATLSRGEAQRIKLGTLLGSKRSKAGASIVLLDEPDRGLAPSDIQALLRALDALVNAGHTVVAISHHRHVWAAADQLIEVRDGNTRHGLELDSQPLGERHPRRKPSPPPAALELRGVTTSNLRGIDVDFPRGKLTVVEGVSGSGKTSLVFGTLAAESGRRFAESLPFQVRRFLRRLPRPALQAARGLTPTLSLRQETGLPTGRSTVATLTEVGPLLRLIFSRAGTLDGLPSKLTASHFSTERPAGACPACSGRTAVERCDPALLITHNDRPLLAARGQGALAGTRPGRFFTEPDGKAIATLLEAASARGEGTTTSLRETLTNTPWQELPESLRTLALDGSGATKLQIRWQLDGKAEGKQSHDFEGTWDGLCALVEREAKIRVRAKAAAEWAAPLQPVPCPTCEGTGLQKDARRTTVCGHTLPALLARPLDELPAAIQARGPVLEALLPELTARLDELIALGLGHLALGRKCASLSAGELQRARLAAVLRSGTSGITLALDEPAAGLHERDVARLMQRLQTFAAMGNTIVLVSHRPSVQAAADHHIALGPGAGDAGGRLIAPIQSAKTPATAIATSAPLTTPIRIRGARAHNLAHLDATLPAAGLVVVTGVSGSGKSSLVFDVLGASLQAHAPIECEALEVPGGFAHFQAVIDARTRTGSGPCALEALGLASELAALFASATPSLPAPAFKLGSARGRCPACRGTGEERIAMDFAPDLDLPCPTCEGRRFRPEVLNAKWQERSIDAWLRAPAAALGIALERSGAKAKKLREAVGPAGILASVALDHIALGRPRKQLSGGESARLTLAASLQNRPSPAVYLFDEPARGLAESDLTRVTKALRKLAARGDLVVATEHRLGLIRAADWVLDLGPEGGPRGGRLVESGAPSSLTLGHTAHALLSS